MKSNEFLNYTCPVCVTEESGALSLFLVTLDTLTIDRLGRIFLQFAKLKVRPAKDLNAIFECSICSTIH